MKFVMKQLREMIEEHPTLKAFFETENEATLLEQVGKLEEQYLFSYTNETMTAGGMEMLSPLMICVILNKSKQTSILLSNAPYLLNKLPHCELEWILQLAIGNNSGDAFQTLLTQKPFMTHFEKHAGSMFEYMAKYECQHVISTILNVQPIASALMNCLSTSHVRKELISILTQFITDLHERYVLANTNSIRHFSPQLTKSEALFFIAIKPYLNEIPGGCPESLVNFLKKDPRFNMFERCDLATP